MSDKSNDEQVRGPAGCVLRLLWMAAGPLAMFACWLSIARSTSLSIYDVLLWLTIVAMIGTRYIDVSRFEGMTVNAEPATMRHVVRYAGALIVLGMAIWGAAHSLEI